MNSNLKSSNFAKLIFLLAAFFVPVFSAAQTQPVHATIDASQTGHPISPYIYGQFLEHGGNIVNEGIWAEMLEDRKFYYPITSKPPEQPVRTIRRSSNWTWKTFELDGAFHRIPQ